MRENIILLPDSVVLLLDVGDLDGADSLLLAVLADPVPVVHEAGLQDVVVSARRAEGAEGDGGGGGAAEPGLVTRPHLHTLLAHRHLALRCNITKLDIVDIIDITFSTQLILNRDLRRS